MYYYELTIRKTAHPVWIVDYEDFFKQFKVKYNFATVEYAYEPERGLHSHALVTSPRRIYVNRFHPGFGWNLSFTTVRNRFAWDNYMAKQFNKQPALINYEYSQYNDFLQYMEESHDPCSPYNLSDSPTHLEPEFPGLDIRNLKSGIYIVEPSG